MPNTLARSVIARAGIPSAAARSTASSMRTIPSVMENSLWSRRWTKAGCGIAGTRRRENFTTRAAPAGRAWPPARSVNLRPAGGRKAQGKRGLGAGLASHADPAAVQVRDRLDDRKAEPRSCRGALARAARAVEAVEDPRQVLA